MAFQEPYAAEVTIPRERADTRAVFGQVMGLVAVTVGFFAAGAWIAPSLTRYGQARKAKRYSRQSCRWLMRWRYASSPKASRQLSN